MEKVAKKFFELVDKKFPEQKDFAKAIGVSPSIVSQWRNGISTSYEKKGRLSKIAQVLEVTLDELHGELAPDKATLLVDANRDGTMNVIPAQELSELDRRRLEFLKNADPAKVRALLLMLGAPEDILED